LNQKLVEQLVLKRPLFQFLDALCERELPPNIFFPQNRHGVVDQRVQPVWFTPKGQLCGTVTTSGRWQAIPPAVPKPLHPFPSHSTSRSTRRNFPGRQAVIVWTPKAHPHELKGFKLVAENDCKHRLALEVN
jgi:hypothetical protein